MKNLENLLNKCKKEIERLEHVETDITATAWVEARTDMLEEFIEWIELLSSFEKSKKIHFEEISAEDEELKEDF